jgi:hypothetical protein
MNYRQTLLAGLLLSTLGSAASAASTDINRQGNLGLGVEVGQPIGVTGKLWLSDMTAVDAALGYHFNHNFDTHADFLLHTNTLTSSMNGTLPLYVGLGARVLAGDDTQFGIRIPFGISYFLTSHKIEFFAEIAPIVDLSNFGADVDGTAGIRLYTF